VNARPLAIAVFCLLASVSFGCSSPETGGSSKDVGGGDGANFSFSDATQGEVGDAPSGGDALDVPLSDGIDLDAVPSCSGAPFCADENHLWSCVNGQITVEECALGLCADTGSGASCQQSMICVPNSYTCLAPKQPGVCKPDGSAYDPTPDLCAEDSLCKDGACLAACNVADLKYGAQFGCEFWTAAIPMFDDPFTHPMFDAPGLAVSNPNTKTVKASVQLGGGYKLSQPSQDIPPGGSVVFPLPKAMKNPAGELVEYGMYIDGTGISDKSVHVSATGPITVHQFLPLATTNYVNEASLILPPQLLGKHYYAISVPGADLTGQTSYFSVIATQDKTNVTIKSTVNVKAASGFNAMKPGSVQTITLGKGQVLTMEAIGTGSIFDLGNQDVTGTEITATKNVAVFSAHKEAVVNNPDKKDMQANGGCCAEHIEEMMLPTDQLAENYVYVRSAPRDPDTEDLVRILAVKDGTTVKTDPPIKDLDGITLNAGKWAEAYTASSFEVHATGPVYVAQILTSAGSSPASYTGDPALIFMIPIPRFPSKHFVYSPLQYPKDTHHWVAVAVKTGHVVTVDGKPTTCTWTPIGPGAWSVCYEQVQEGAHVIDSDEPFYSAAYGYYAATAYAYVGGIKP